MADVLVVGAGICGLGTALLLARDGHEVTVLEQDASVEPQSPEDAWERWSRKGVPQFRQPHNFMPGLRRILEAELPDVQEALREAGAGRFDLLNPQPFGNQSAHPIDDQLWTYTARRPVGEWVFATAASKEPSLNIRRGVKAERLIAGASVREDIPHVAGVRTAEGEEVTGDLVVDASGRGSRAPRWLEAIGARTPHADRAEHGFFYYTRYFRGQEPERRAPVQAYIGTVTLLTLPGDNGTWSVTVFTSSGDKELKNLRQADRWTRTVRACPRHAHWLDGEPISDVHVMGGVLDRRRRLVIDGTPVATGFVCVADAWACTNPSAGRGLTVGFDHAVRLRDALREGLEDPVDFQLRFHALTERDVAPWYDAQVARDTYRFAEIEALRRGEEPPAPDGAYLPIHNLRTVMSADPFLFRAALEYIGTLTPVQEILKRAEVQERMSAVLERMKDAPPPTMPGPDRGELLALVG
jgi:2-polyprenyl-6-methoxyphenol hydroxylase-like FAD-dependent oxidoreductase